MGHWSSLCFKGGREGACLIISRVLLATFKREERERSETTMSTLWQSLGSPSVFLHPSFMFKKDFLTKTILPTLMRSVDWLREFALQGFQTPLPVSDLRHLLAKMCCEIHLRCMNPDAIGNAASRRRERQFPLVNCCLTTRGREGGREGRPNQEVAQRCHAANNVLLASVLLLPSRVSPHSPD